MTKVMNDKEFLDYCRAHCSSPRAAFVPSQIARLLRLNGEIEYAHRWETAPNRIIDGCREAILSILDQIEEKRKKQVSLPTSSIDSLIGNPNDPQRSSN